jgi:hypothetical protein
MTDAVSKNINFPYCMHLYLTNKMCVASTIHTKSVFCVIRLRISCYFPRIRSSSD